MASVWLKPRFYALISSAFFVLMSPDSSLAQGVQILDVRGFGLTKRGNDWWVRRGLLDLGFATK